MYWDKIFYLISLLIGIKNIKGLFNLNLSKKINKNFGKFNLIIANNVIANIDDLRDVFSGIKKLISKNAHLVIETFCLHGILKNNLIDNIYHEHLSYFSIETFKKFAKKYDLYLKEAQFLKVKGGSLRLIFQNKIIQENKNINYRKLIFEKGVSKISVIGVGMITTPGVTFRMFQTLANKKINIQVISTSEIKISVLIDKKNTKKALIALHKEFKLDNKK